MLPGGAGPQQEQLEWVGLQPSSVSDSSDKVIQNAWSIYTEQLKLNKPELLFHKLHDTLSMENDSFWSEILGQGFEQLGNVTQAAIEQDEVSELSTYTTNELAHLLEFGMPEKQDADGGAIDLVE